MGSVAFPAWIPYASAGVDEEREQDVFARAMRPWLARTAVRSPLVTHITGLASGYFATMMHIPPGPPLALTTDGVGTKILLAREANRWEPIGIDCVANNVNDVICTGAVPLALLDYMATDRIDEVVLEEVARGLYLGATEAGIAIPGGEIAQIGAMLAPAAGGPPMLDLVGTAIGALPPGREPVDGSRVSAGDVILALPSSGLHSNGYSLARRALFEMGRLSLDSQVPGTGQRLDDALLAPTRVYVRAAEALWAAGVTPAGPGAHLRRRPAQPGAPGRGRVVRPGRAAARAAGVRADRRGRAGAAGDDVRHLQHGHRLLRGCFPRRRAGGDRRAEAMQASSLSLAGSVTGRHGRYVSIPAAGLARPRRRVRPGRLTRRLTAPPDLPAVSDVITPESADKGRRSLARPYAITSRHGCPWLC